MTLSKTLPLLTALCLFNASHAGSLQLSFSDDAGNPLPDVVATLLSTSPQPGTQASGTPAVAIVDQRDNQFVPHVSVVRTNTLVSFPNSDNVRHHVYSFSPVKSFELRLYHGTMSEPVLFDQPGQAVLGCNIHDSMLAYIYIVDTDYFAVSDVNGQLQIIDIAPGEYELQLQHPRSEELTYQYTHCYDNRQCRTKLHDWPPAA